MKKSPLLLAVGLTAFTLLFAPGPDAQGQDAIRKFGRGFSNIFFGWTDLPMIVHQEDSRNGPAAALTYGLAKGFARFGQRFGVGIYEIATFPIPWPHGYWPTVNPEFPLSSYNENILMYE